MGAIKCIRWIWECSKCKDVVESYSHKRHDMNFCDCGKSAVDLEQSYARNMGYVNIISIRQNINNEWVEIEK